jgi:DNA-3-methyladenine glycosylase I
MVDPARKAAENSAPNRCHWCGPHADYQTYHDTEWGFPVSSDRHLFEKLCLEGFQSGLSWLTILRKREAFRRAFALFDFEQLAAWNERDVDRLVQDASIVRHRAKIEATLGNAKRALTLRQEFGSLAAFFWQFEPGEADRPPRLDERTVSRLTWTPASRALSDALRQRGFRFVGPTTAYAFMQSMGIVNDHVETCDTRQPVERARAEFQRPTRARAL